MTIRTRLTLLFTAIVTALLLLFFLSIYWVAEQYRRTEYYERLRGEALASAELLFGKETISRELFKLLDKNHMTVLNDEEIIIYNYLNKLEYESGTDYLNVDKNILDRVRLEKEVKWREGDREIVGVLFTDRYNHLVVFASAIDIYGFRKQKNLALILSAGWVLSILVMLATGWVYAGRALAPLKRIIGRVDGITTSRLDLRLEEAQSPDEIGQLAQRFNQMLDRLEEGFRVQRMFVSNASHELRTPLTAITGQIEVALMVDDDPQEWQATLRSVLDDVRQLNRLSNGLLTLAGVSIDESLVKTTQVPIDDLLGHIRSELLKAHPDYQIDLKVPLAQTEADFSVLGNEALLRVALLNLMENGGKFSPNHGVSVAVLRKKNEIVMQFQNDGLPIPDNELPQIFKPFRRGSNAHQVNGHGIGLSLVERIVRLHRGRIDVVSNQEVGTIFTVTLPQ
ncbi:MAG: HAMP domain-containing protein [Cytophagia bacterium]|nr:MAG: HAMP domain-containing protein [Runella sp.]TAG16299.1 MAG: HAMP domain-containing protein [Cytophagales bacterium]TAG35566.1 MAG: HAMP domain-containing protein [Cytophagia bacterium]TAG77379.1 MAG: HAMP domain-containing protein [Cytophagales bacterium]